MLDEENGEGEVAPDRGDPGPPFTAGLQPFAMLPVLSLRGQNPLLCATLAAMGGMLGVEYPVVGEGSFR